MRHRAWLRRLKLQVLTRGRARRGISGERARRFPQDLRSTKVIESVS
jgi:hypothetical protein